MAKCFNCLKIFDRTLDRQIFCSSKCKTRWSKAHPDSCFYCDAVSWERDHIVPAIRRGSRRYGVQETVPACSKCNSFLGSKEFYLPTDRFDFLASSYRNYYELYKPEVEWSKRELAELSENLRENILRISKERTMAENKLSILLSKREEFQGFE